MKTVIIVILMALACAISAQQKPAAKPAEAANPPATTQSPAAPAAPSAAPAPAAQPVAAPKAQATSSLIQSFADAAAGTGQEDFIIKKPGELTFTTGVVIEGRVEKPQVMLILSKEALRLEPETFEQSFTNKITRPLQYNAFEFMGEKKK